MENKEETINTTEDECTEEVTSEEPANKDTEIVEHDIDADDYPLFI